MSLTLRAVPLIKIELFVLLLLLPKAKKKKKRDVKKKAKLNVSK